eukprot:826980-Karenia_brevis.AAC.1
MQVREWADIQVAYHCTALANLGVIQKERLTTGCTVTQDTYGVYCEGQKRRNPSLRYICHMEI